MRPLILWLALLLLTVQSQAIVIRHDVDDAKYLATADDFPALATFYVDGAHGALIGPKWIITAAHATFCVSPGSFAYVGGEMREVENVFVHADYTPSQSHDIALVELKYAVSDVQPAEAYELDDELGKQPWFIGIGGTGNGSTGETIDNAANMGVLRKAQNTIIAAEEPLIKFIFNKNDNALPLEGVSGGGDSGGPAFMRENGRFKVLGISSRPEGNFSVIGEYGITEVYTRVSFFQDWIEQIVAGNKEVQERVSTSRIKHLPAGLTEDILPMVCEDIGLTTDNG